jgi:2-desacetyl-2-hydroxyethyl bacteriochlorophyllide A dehydrogenase
MFELRSNVRAIVIDGPGRVEIREVPEPNAGPDDVVVASRAAGVCRTDLNILHGLVPSSVVAYPCIPGHEWSGTIAEVGTNVDDLRPGDRVVCEGRIPCGRCANCRAGETNLCANYDQVGFTRPGGYAELVAVPRKVVHRLPEGLSFAGGALIEPASCVLRGLQRALPRRDEAIGVVGVGTLGAIALMLASRHSPRIRVAYGTRVEELSLAKELGADLTVDVSAGDPEEQTISSLGGGLDLVIEAAGGVRAIDTATRVVRPGGRVVVLGSAGEGARLDIPADRLMRKDLMVVGSLSYTSASWSDLLGVVVDAQIPLDRLVTHRFPLDDFSEAFRLMERPVGRLTKIVLEHASPRA